MLRIACKWCVILFATQLLFAKLANGCDLVVPVIQSNDTLYINNQTELSRWWPYRKPINCTSFQGSIAISPSYDGNLTLDKVTDISGAIYNTQAPLSANTFDSTLGNFTANDLVSVGVLQLQSTRRLRALQVPKLEVARDIFLDNIATKFLVLPSLRNTSRISLGNLITSWGVNPAPIIDLPALERIDDYLYFNEALAKRESYRSLLSTSIGLQATFPSLVSCPTLFLFGSLQILALPKLSCVGCNEDINNNIVGFWVENIGNSLLPLNLLNLSESSAITIVGNIHRYTNIPSCELSLTQVITQRLISHSGILGNISKQFTINNTSNQPLDIDLPALTHVGQLSLRGNITRVNLPSLQSFMGINIQSNYSKIDCSSPIAAYERIRKTTYSPKNNTVDSDFYCGVFPVDRRNAIQRRRISMGVDLGLGLPVALLILSYLYMRWRKIRRGNINGVGDDVVGHELSTLRPESARSGRSIKTVLPPYERGLAPPEYSPGTSAAAAG